MANNNKLTLKVTKLAFYNGCLVYPNEIIKNFKGKVPSWATLADGKETKPEEKAPVEPKAPEIPVEKEPEKEEPEAEVKVEPEEKEEAEAPQEAPVEEKETAQENVEAEEKSEVELQEELDALLNESVDKGIVLDNFEKMTITEQIAELKVLLGK